VVDHDIDIRDPIDVEYAVATRMEASADLFMIPGARGHEYVRVSKEGVRTKLGIDATVPFEDQDKFRRVEFAPTPVELSEFTAGEAVARNALGLAGSNIT
jgi:2,5-furandicarboxylate decarboxylase 1